MAASFRIMSGRSAQREASMAADGISGKTLEERVRLIEDRFAIYDLIARHPPSADTGAGEFVASVWAEDGVFDRGAEFLRPSGRAAIAVGSAHPLRNRPVGVGIAHFAGLPYVVVAGYTLAHACLPQFSVAGPAWRV